jgi:GT2 family glycosyltransferase
MKLSIIIVNWNTGDLLRQCLHSIVDTTKEWPADTVETFVVDNASQDDSVARARSEHPWVQFFENTENVGFAGGNNQAFPLCSGQYVLLLNPDTKLMPGALQMLVAFMDAHPEVGACGPLLLNADGSLQPSCSPMLTPGREFWRLTFLDRLWPRATYPQHRWDRESPRRVEVIKGACFLLRQKAVDQVGLLDEQYFMYTEEIDLCYRLIQAGWQLYWIPQAQVIHYGEASSKQIADAMYLQLYRSKVQFYRKFGGTHRATLFKILLAFAYVPRWVVALLGQYVTHRLRAPARIYGQFLLELPKL